MATYVVRNCPHCGYEYRNGNWESVDLREYGCPYTQCGMCGKTFWDTHIVEPALYYGYVESKSFLEVTFVIFFYGLFGLGMIGVCSWLLIGGYMESDGVYGILFMLAMGIITLWRVIKRIQYEVKNSKSITQKRAEYDASKLRLQDTDYLTALAGYDKRAKKLLQERLNGDLEHYAERP